MPLTEQELRQHLEAAARQANPSRFTVGDLAGRIRLRRAKVIAVASGCLAAVAVLAVAIPLELAGGGTSVVGAASGPAPYFRVPFAVSLNGQRPSILPSGRSRPSGCGSPAAACPPDPGPGFNVTPGEHLTIIVSVTIPAQARVTGLWLGVSTGAWGPTKTGPVGMWTTLAHPGKVLRGGRHEFRLTWTLPARLRHATDLWLAASWYGVLPGAYLRPAQEQPISAAVGQPLAQLVVSH